MKLSATMISEPGVYEVSEELYHSDPVKTPSLSSSLAKTLINKSPWHAWFNHPRLNPNFESEHQQKYDIGSAAHALMLDQDEKLIIVPFDSYRKNAAKDMRDQAYLDGNIPLLEDQFENVSAMIKSGKHQLQYHEDAELFFKKGCMSEVTGVWKEKGVWCRCKFDRISPEKTVIFDYKTTNASAHPEAWARTGFGMNVEVQVDFYRRCALSLWDKQITFIFIVQETEPPYAVSVVGITPQAAAVGEAQVDLALSLWKHCLKNDVWPGYPTKTCWIDMPPWKTQQWLDTEGEKDSNAISEMKRMVFESYAPTTEICND